MPAGGARRPTSSSRRRSTSAGLGAWHVAHTEAAAKGRAGVAVVSRRARTRARCGVGRREEFAERALGRGRRATAAGPVTVVSAYVHTGEADTARQEEKFRFLDAIEARPGGAGRATGAVAVVTGDLNVAHREDDLKNWRGNLRQGRVPRRGSAPTSTAGSVGDWVGRRTASCTGAGPGPYTWWSWRGKAFDNDAGWRIDYQLATSGPRRARPHGRGRPRRSPTTSAGATTPRSRSTTTSAPEALTATAHSTLTYCPRTAHSPPASQSTQCSRAADPDAVTVKHAAARKPLSEKASSTAADRQRGPIERNQRNRGPPEAAAGHPCAERAGAPCRLDGGVELVAGDLVVVAQRGVRRRRAVRPRRSRRASGRRRPPGRGRSR